MPDPLLPGSGDNRAQARYLTTEREFLKDIPQMPETSPIGTNGQDTCSGHVGTGGSVQLPVQWLGFSGLAPCRAFPEKGADPAGLT